VVSQVTKLRIILVRGQNLWQFYLRL